MTPKPHLERLSIPDALPVLPLRDLVLYPDSVAPIVVAQPRSVEMVNEVLRGNQLAAVVAQKNVETAPARAEDVYRVATVAVLHELARAENAVRLVVQGVARVRIVDFVQQQPYLIARIDRATEPHEEGVELDALVRTAKDLFGALVRIAAELPDELAAAADKTPEPSQLAYFMAAAVPLPLTVRQELLELDTVSARLRRLIELLQHELAVRQIVRRITTETAQEMAKAEREHILHKQMESIERELRQIDPTRSALGELRAKVGELPEDPRKEALHELDRLEHTPEASPEHGMIRTYLDWLLKVPWQKVGGERIDIERARAVLDEDHYDLSKVKERILDYLAVKHLREERQVELDTHKQQGRIEPILCFVGPPGVGKTSLGQSIARALGRAFAHQSLGGVHDEAEIRGHRRTYVGAMPGRVIQTLARAGTADPVFMLDEIDKLSAGFQGDPAAALLELLDPAQNNAFTDTYLGLPLDLSRVLFICTANTMDSIPSPLLDRMEVLTLAGYTQREKLEIAKRFLIPTQYAANGVRPEEVLLDEDTIPSVIRGYTREAGVRNLERSLATIFRKAARRITEKQPTPFTVQAADLHDYLGPARYFDEVAERIDRPGVAAGLSWTPAGGDVLFVEASMIPGDEDQLILTGMLGNVMRESAQAALTYLRAQAPRLGINSADLRERRVVHVHVPAGAVPKDGPSAGVTLLAAMASHALGRPVAPGVAMTGEITLRGKVLPVGGIKEKVLAAHRAGLATVILPRRNEGDLEDVPEEVRRALHFVFVESVDEVLAEALGITAPESRTKLKGTAA